MSSADVEVRDLRSLEDCRAVVAIQEEVWGRDGETVPASVLFVSAKSGGILLGASAPLAGFVWSMPGVRDGVRTHWSHMLGVLPAHREHRLGERLKWAQRQRAIAQGAEIIEWTFDPLQAPNAHFNLSVLGGVGASYGVDIYGALSGPLHRGTPTDRLIVEWRISEAHVERRFEARQRQGAPVLQARSAEVLTAPVVIDIVETGGWVAPKTVNAGFDDRRVLMPIPPRFLEMQQQETEIALAWRMAAREVMTSALGRGYKAVDFLLDRERGGGAYVLARASNTY